MSVVIDTNVILAADGQALQADAGCVSVCATELESAQGGLVCLDAGGEILSEYQRKVAGGYPLGVGLSFVGHLQNNLYNPAHCERVPIVPHRDRLWAEFPDDPELAAFDRADRKFVAVARASELAPMILNATDSDWWPAREAFARHDVHVSLSLSRAHAYPSTQCDVVCDRVAGQMSAL